MPEMLSRTAQATTALTRLKPVWNDRNIFSQFQDTTDVLFCHIHLPVCLWIIDPRSRASLNFTGVGVTEGISILTCNVVYFQHSNMNIFAWLQSKCGMQQVTVSIIIQLNASVTAWLWRYGVYGARDFFFFLIINQIYCQQFDIFWMISFILSMCECTK